MPNSMTGFGAAEGPVAGGRLRVEIRTVNHRYFNLAPKLPSDLSGLEGELRERLRREFDRGHVAVQARWTEYPERAGGLAVDLDRARLVTSRLRELQIALGLGGEVTVEMVLSAELRHRVDLLEQSAEAIARRAPERLVRERDRLRGAVAELLDGRQPDEARLAQEIAFQADRLDITEELVRFRAHVAAVREALAADRPAGKQLGFLAQELGREVNTIGSKANDAEIAQQVIAMKGELEKFREQLENLE